MYGCNTGRHKLYATCHMHKSIQNPPCLLLWRWHGVNKTACWQTNLLSVSSHKHISDPSWCLEQEVCSTAHPSINTCQVGDSCCQCPYHCWRRSGEHLRVSSRGKKAVNSLYCSRCLITGRIKRWQISYKCRWHIHLPGSTVIFQNVFHCIVELKPGFHTQLIGIEVQTI